MQNDIPDTGRLLERVREQKPLVHHITNWVTIYDCAQVVKTLGASPVMAHAPEESADMATLASALVLNIGTLTREIVASMKTAARAANKKGIPVVLDVCGAGATKMRDLACAEIIAETRVDVVKGNSSEIARVAGGQAVTKGVDSAEVAEDMTLVATALSKKLGSTVVVTGQTDIVCGDGATYLVHNGHPMMATIVGTGCMATSVIGTFCAIEKNLAEASAAALSCFGIAGEIAAQESNGPVSFKNALFDTLHALDKKTIAAGVRIEKAGR